MNKILKTIALGLILTACQDDESLTINKEWTQISNWGQESYARCIAVNGSTIFVGTDREIYRSTNNGDTWTKLPPYTQVAHLNGLRSLHIKTNTLFGGEPADGFIKSNDNGKTWTKVPNSIHENEAVYSIASNSNYVFIGTYGSGLFRSNDNGESWVNVFETASIGEPIWNIAVEGDNILIFIPKKGLFVSSDNGSNWTDITKDIDVESGSGAIYIKGQTILIGTSKFYKSNDLGTTWQEITQESGFEVPGCLWSITSFENTIYASAGLDTGAGIFYSKDNGESWTKTPINDKFFDTIFNLGVNDNYVFGVDQYNVHRISRTN
jgi:photosystem II stability/assembly factor-like uncharacterized protein